MNMAVIKRACAAALLALCFLPKAAGAQDSAPASRSRLSVLAVCAGPELSGREKHLITELELALDGFDIITVDPGLSNFRELSETEQVKVIRASTRNASDTSPVIWLECDIWEKTVVRLLLKRVSNNFPFPSQGKAGMGSALGSTQDGVFTIRNLEGGSVEEVALAVREIVSDSFQISSTGETAQEAEPQTETEEEPIETEQPGLRVGILTAFEIGGGLVGHEGSSFLWGGGIAVDLRIPLGFFGRLAFVAKMGPRAEDRELLMIGYRIEPRVEVGYLWTVGFFEVGPMVTLAPMWNSINFAIADGYHQYYSWWSVRFAGGVDSRFKLTDRLSIVLDLTLGFMPNKRFYRRLSKSTLLKTPTMDLAATLGLIVEI